MAALDFNPMQHDVLGEGYAVYPAGRYPVAVKKDEVKGNASNTSGYLQLDMEILDGPHKGGMIPWRINLYNQNDQAREIAGKELATVCFACNIHHLPDSSMLRGIPFQVQIVENEMDYRANDDRSKPKKKTNNVVGVYTINGDAVSKPNGNNGGGGSGPPQNFANNNGGQGNGNGPDANQSQGGSFAGGNGNGGGQPQNDPNAGQNNGGGNGWQGNGGNAGNNGGGGGTGGTGGNGWQGNAGGGQPQGGGNGGGGGTGGGWSPGGNGGGAGGGGGAPAWAGGNG